VSPRIVALVCARGGSKGVPGKNLREIAGRSLVEHAVEVARACRRVERVVLSSDSPEIAERARRAGAEVPALRPAELATDSSPEWLTWQHTLGLLDASAGPLPIDALVVVPPTAPLRAVCDVEACIERMCEGLREAPPLDAVFTVTPSHSNPYFNMLAMDSDGHVRRVLELDPPVHRRQDAPLVYDITTVAYAVRADFVRTASNLFVGRAAAVEVPRERAIDIDTEHDLRLAEIAYAERELAGSAGELEA